MVITRLEKTFATSLSGKNIEAHIINADESTTNTGM